MQIKDATPTQIRDHIGGCTACLADQVLILRLDLFNGERDECERRFLGHQVDERVGEIHGWHI